MMRSGYDWLKSHVLRCRRNDVVSVVLFQLQFTMCEPP